MKSPTTRAALLITVGSIVVGGIGVALAFVWKPSLPDPVATHWGTGGPDQFTATSLAVWLPLIGTITGLLLGALMLALTRKVPAMTALAVGFGVGIGGFVTALVTGLLGIQRGLDDATAAPDATWQIALALVIAVLLGIAAASAFRALSPAPRAADRSPLPPVPADAPRTALPEGAVAAWSGWSTAGPALHILLAAVLLPSVVAMILGVAPVAIATSLAVVALVIAGTSTFRVTVGRFGLSVRSILGWPRFQTPLTDIASAETTRVRPLADFGGWGVRMGRRGRFGVVLRAGSALAVHRRDGSTFVVTLDRPGEAAALLNTLADRDRVLNGPGRSTG